MDGQDILSLLAFILAGLILAASFVVSAKMERKRQSALARTAVNLGLRFSPHRNHWLAEQYSGLRGLSRGDNRYAFDIFRGNYCDRTVTAFDFHYEVSSSSSKGHRNTTHYHLHVVLLHLEQPFPGLFIAPEGILSKIAQAAGYNDIDFESHEFSRLFCVRSPDKKFAYDFCNALMIDLLLGHPGLRLEVRENLLALVFDGKMDSLKIESALDLACAIRERMPAYLFAA